MKTAITLILTLLLATNIQAQFAIDLKLLKPLKFDVALKNQGNTLSFTINGKTKILEAPKNASIHQVGTYKLFEINKWYGILIDTSMINYEYGQCWVFSFETDWSEHTWSLNAISERHKGFAPNYDSEYFFFKNHPFILKNRNLYLEDKLLIETSYREFEISDDYIKWNLLDATYHDSLVIWSNKLRKIERTIAIRANGFTSYQNSSGKKVKKDFSINAVHHRLSTDGRHLAIQLPNSKIEIFNTEDGKVIAEFQDAFYKCDFYFESDANQLVIGTPDKLFRTLELNNYNKGFRTQGKTFKESLKDTELRNKLVAGVGDILFCNIDKFFFSTDWSSVIMWDANKLLPIRNFVLPSDFKRIKKVHVYKSLDHIAFLGESPAEGNAVIVFESATGRVVGRFVTSPGEDDTTLEPDVTRLLPPNDFIAVNSYYKVVGDNDKFQVYSREDNKKIFDFSPCVFTLKDNLIFFSSAYNDSLIVLDLKTTRKIKVPVPGSVYDWGYIGGEYFYRKYDRDSIYFINFQYPKLSRKLKGSFEISGYSSKTGGVALVESYKMNDTINKNRVFMYYPINGKMESIFNSIDGGLTSVFYNGNNDIFIENTKHELRTYFKKNGKYTKGITFEYAKNAPSADSLIKFLNQVRTYNYISNLKLRFRGGWTFIDNLNGGTLFTLPYDFWDQYLDGVELVRIKDYGDNHIAISRNRKKIFVSQQSDLPALFEFTQSEFNRFDFNSRDFTWEDSFREDGGFRAVFSYSSNLLFYPSNSGIGVLRQKAHYSILNPSYFPVATDTTDTFGIFSTGNYDYSVVDLRFPGKKFTVYLIDSLSWITIHSSGLFDCPPNSFNELYFVQGLDIIPLSSLKDRYYEPNLLNKILKGEKLRDVVGFKSIELPPDVELLPVDKKGYLPIKVINRGGGIGKVSVYINGKEVIEDARQRNLNINQDSIKLNVYVGNAKNLVKGTENFIGVKAWNAGNWVVSSGTFVTYETGTITQYSPSIHILSCGVSDYTGTEIDLKFAAKDAEDVSKALQLGAKELFGTERSYVYTLTTNRAKDYFPTKSNILRTLEKISATAHPLDVFVMYVSGHGINYGGQDGDWCYLTQDAYTGNGSAYNDPVIRKQTTISSSELVELFKKVPALKQILIIDACASGRVVENLMTQKDISSNTLRALDRMRDRTGMHIITGCTADAVSYEASKYGQGVLTYSLLEGIRGAALREDKFVDINKLFQYAHDRVPILAEGIGGIQTPQIFSPQGAQSFDIGLLNESEKKEIPIAKIRPVYIRSNFQDENELEDVLGLGKIIDEALNEVSGKGAIANLIFVDVKDYPDGCKLIGRYQKIEGKINLKLRKKCGEETVNYEIKADNLDQLKAEILKML